MTVRNLLFILLLYVSENLIAQPTRLKEMLAEQNAAQKEVEIRIRKFLESNKNVSRVSRQGNSIQYLVDVDRMGLPVYFKTYNLEASQNVGVPELRSGGNLGINLGGDGIQVGVWDEGLVRSSHSEFGGGNGFHRALQNDSAAYLSAHTTHVTGTILAQGIQPSARGMAPESKSINYDFLNDVAEMLANAKPDQTSLLLSNHSYGTIAGWNNNKWYGLPN